MEECLPTEAPFFTSIFLGDLAQLFFQQLDPLTRITFGHCNKKLHTILQKYFLREKEEPTAKTADNEMYLVRKSQFLEQCIRDNNVAALEWEDF